MRIRQEQKSTLHYSTLLSSNSCKRNGAELRCFAVLREKAEGEIRNAQVRNDDPEFAGFCKCTTKMGIMDHHPDAYLTFCPPVIIGYNLEKKVGRADQNTFLPGCYCAANYVHFLSPFTAAGDVCTPTLFQEVVLYSIRSKYLVH
ncbi:hypothetical protein C2S53_015475 [Perilla frutescens var. hirtella]|uniref:Uncharacterized protein n=1 Tax=Perilla frutescens var. hirtella TaxID=608512 RepID=A0AAD4IV30_PERFH|nr:hypothetical protein C2S53_015475 [Perilla frutescens var. hirtella]